MPSHHRSSAAPDWDRLYELAAAAAGYFKLRDAAAAGYSSPLLEFHVRRGRVERVGRGIFRLTHFPPGEHEDLVIAWLWSNRTGVFSHETALVLHRLSDALPARHHMTVPAPWKRRRLRVPANLILSYEDLPATDRAWNGPVPVTTPLRTLTDCARAHVPPDLIQQASTQGVKRGLFTREEARAALTAVQARRDSQDAASR